MAGKFRRIRNTRVTVGEIRAFPWYGSASFKLPSQAWRHAPPPTPPPPPAQNRKSKVNRVFRELVNIKRTANLGLNDTGLTRRRVPLGDFHWVPHPSVPLGGRVFKGQKDPRCVEPGICRVVGGRRLLLRKWPRKEIDNNLLDNKAFVSRSVNLERNYIT